MRADTREMRFTRRGGGSKSGWDVLPNPRASSSRTSRDLGRGSKRRHDASRARHSPNTGALTRGRGSSQNPRRSPSAERGRYDDFDLAAAAVVSRRHNRLEDRSPPPPLSPQLWGVREALSFDRNLARDDIHDEFYRGHQRADPPSDARLSGGLVELGDTRHHRNYINDGSLNKLSSSGAEIDRDGRLIQKSVYLDDVGSRRMFLPLSSDRTVHLEEPSAMNPGSTMGRISTGDALRIMIPAADEPRYREYSKIAPYNDEERGTRIYSMEVSPYPTAFSSQRRRLPATSASHGAPVEAEFPVSFRDELHQRPSDDTLGRSIDFRSFRDEPLDRGPYSWTDTENVNAQTIADPIAYEPRGQNFSEYDWKRRINAEEDDSWYSESERIYKKARWGSRGEDVYPLARRDSRSLEERHYLEEGPISGFQEMEYLAYRGKPSHRDEVSHLVRNHRYSRDDLGDYRDDLEDLNILRDTRNARALEMDDEDERMEREFSSARRPVRFDHSRLGTLNRRVSDFDLKGRPRRNFDRKDRMREKGLKSEQSVGDFDERSLPKIDPPEDSEEFKQLTHKAFLRFSKFLNEDSTRRETYRQEGKASQGFLCYVCGSKSKEFADVHSLVTHSFHSLKAGLKTEHLGLHKALCVLMGWNWAMPPDKSKRYKRKPDPDVEVLKEDLIIWPPIMIIRNLSVIKKTSTKEPNLVNSETLEKILKGMKVDMGKVKVSGGKAGDKSTLLVKYMPTLSGLHEADELHKVFKEKKRGRKELEEAASSSSLQSSEEEEWLYGYMGTVEDLDRLDSDTKRRCVLKSKKDIENIADAPIEARPE